MRINTNLMISLTFQNLNIMQDFHFMFQHRYITHYQGHVSLWISLSIFWRTFIISKYLFICSAQIHKYLIIFSNDAYDQCIDFDYIFISISMDLKLYIAYYFIGWKFIILFCIIFLVILKRTIRVTFVNLFCKPHTLHFYYNGLQRRNGPTCYLTSCIKKNGF